MEPAPVLTSRSRPVRRRSARGFSLVELIVVLAIIVILTGIVLSGQSSFNNTLTVTDTSYTVALSVRQAQTFGLSSRAYSGVSNAAYGVHFASAAPTAYQLFADIYPSAPGAASSYCPGHTAGAGNPDAKPGNCTFDAGQNEIVQNFSFNRGFSITNICGRDTGNATHCTAANGTATVDLTGIDIVFLRPNTDSIVTGLRSSSYIPLKDAQITVTAPTGGARLICVTSVGEVSVATSTCP